MNEKYMKQALALARKGFGKVSPNPCVGAVLVKNGRIVGKGFHKCFGGDHAEVAAIKNAGSKAQRASLYVTLEPCCHFGKTPPCVAAIKDAGIKEVFVAVKDPNPKVNGKGIRKLRSAGIKVTLGLLEDEAKELLQPYLKALVTPLPYVVLKTACTLDFKIANKNKKSKWITSKKSRDFARRLRSECDAIITGVGTVLKDDPRMTAKSRPLRVILDSNGRTSLNAKVLKDKNVLLVVTDKAKVSKYKGYEVLNMGNKITIKRLLKKLYSKGIRSVFVEAGNKVNTSFIKASVVDKFYLFVASKLFGEGLDAFDVSLPTLKKRKALKIGEDVLFEFFVNLY
jgi:diaminohydroxyphosphoribosylaminopyrimidine deaminase / 5-amino-6-(5-phosphoribosylamino)uracil reductase